MIVAKWLGCDVAAVERMSTYDYDMAIEMIKEENEAIQKARGPSE